VLFLGIEEESRPDAVLRVSAQKGCRLHYNACATLECVTAKGRTKAVGVDQWAAAEAAEIRRRYFKGKFVVGVGPTLE
jgi:hypothetical protein